MPYGHGRCRPAACANPRPASQRRAWWDPAWPSGRSLLGSAILAGAVRARRGERPAQNAGRVWSSSATFWLGTCMGSIVRAALRPYMRRSAPGLMRRFWQGGRPTHLRCPHGGQRFRLSAARTGAAAAAPPCKYRGDPAKPDPRTGFAGPVSRGAPGAGRKPHMKAERAARKTPEGYSRRPSGRHPAALGPAGPSPARLPGACGRPGVARHAGDRPCPAGAHKRRPGVARAARRAADARGRRVAPPARPLGCS